MRHLFIQIYKLTYYHVLYISATIIVKEHLPESLLISHILYSIGNCFSIEGFKEQKKRHFYRGVTLTINSAVKR